MSGGDLQEARTLANRGDTQRSLVCFFPTRGGGGGRGEGNKERSGNAAALRRKELCMILFELTCYVNDNVQLPE